jgi:hypothetical protein
MSLAFLPRARAKFAVRCASRHLLISVVVALFAAVLVFQIWYPESTSKMLKVGHLYTVLLAVDVVCGPLLTLVLASPEKPRREFLQDLGLVGLIQLGALGYGLHALESARPIAYVFEQDRVMLVAKNELYTAGCSEAKPCDLEFGLWGIRQHTVQMDQLNSNRLRSLDLSLQGAYPAMRPETWGEWSWNDVALQSALHPLTALRSDAKEALVAIKGVAYAERRDLRYLPLVSSKSPDWIAVFDEQGGWLDTLPIDGFE